MLTLNTVNPDNFNETCVGYIRRALEASDTLTEEQMREVLRNLYWSFDYMTMEDARMYNKR